MKEEVHLNLQEPRTSKIYGITKQGANKQDVNAIRTFQAQGLDEHDIASRIGVHFNVVRSFMAVNDKNFEPSDPRPNADTQFLHDRIADLEKQNAESGGDDEGLKSQIADLEKDKENLAADLDTANSALSEATKDNKPEDELGVTTNEADDGGASAEAEQSDQGAKTGTVAENF